MSCARVTFTLCAFSPVYRKQATESENVFKCLYGDGHSSLLSDSERQLTFDIAGKTYIVERLQICT